MSVTKVFLEWFSFGSYSHMYLVKRECAEDPVEFEAQQASLAWRETGQVISGGPKYRPFGLGPLIAETGLLSASEDRYSSQSQVHTRGILDITDAVNPALWVSMVSFANAIHANKYDYEAPWPTPPNHVANSNAVVLSVLNSIEIDVRTLIPNLLSVPGAKENATLVGGFTNEQGENVVIASPNLTLGGASLLGLDTKNDFMVGTEFSDRFYGEQVANYNATRDTVSYENANEIFKVAVTKAGIFSPNEPEVTVSYSHSVNGNISDQLFGIEKVILSSQNDQAVIGRYIPNWLEEIDAKGQTSAAGDKIIFHQWGSAKIKIDAEGNLTIGGAPNKLKLKNFEYLETGEGNNRIDSQLKRSDAGGQLMSSEAGSQLIIDLGAGDDILLKAGAGTEVITGAGHDEIQVTGGIAITDLSPDDVVKVGGLELHGGHRYKWSESEWATSFGGAVRWGINHVGELVINVTGLGSMFVTNWAGSGGMDVPFEQRPGHISVYEYDVGIYRFLDPNRPSHMTQMGTWNLMGTFVQAYFGVKIWKENDPLTLDLDGDGLELTYQTSLSPFFDIDGDLYAERTGWVGGDDGILVRDLNGSGTIDDVTELFGGARSGFEALAELDGNDDGKVDANDNGLADFNGDGTIDANDTFASLKVWRDLDGDIETDVGELFSLADLGIVSISVDNTPDGATMVAGNRIASTATFTRADNSTGAIADVWYHIDNVNTQYTGGPITISNEAAALPEHKGFGTLVSLREAMSLDPDLVDIVEATLPQMSSLDLNTLRMQALPILTGWALASPLGDGDNDPNTSAPRLKEHRDIPVLVDDGAFGQDEVLDFAYETSVTLLDENEEPYTLSYWALATGAAIKGENDEIIDYPTLAQVLASPQVHGEWGVFSGDAIGFVERYIGESLPLDRVMPEGTGPITGFADLFTSVLKTIDLAVVRIAVQAGPLAPFFAGIEYDAENNNFHAADSNDRELIPVFEAIFTEAKNAGHNVAWIEQWKPILDIVIGDFVRDEAYLLNTFSSLAQNIVAAYENSDLTLNFHAVATALGIPDDALVTGTGTVNGSDDADIFYTGGGDETLKGGKGPDTYVFGEAIGHDVIDDIEPALQGGQLPDMIRFAHLTPADISAARDGLDLILTVTATGETIKILRQFEGVQPGLFGGDISDDTGVGEIVFADGTVWDLIEIAEAVRDPRPTSDIVAGTPSVDFLDGGAGDDMLSGGDAGDLYYFSIGYDDDVVEDNQANVLIETPDMVLFGSGLTAANVMFTRNGNSSDLVIGISGNDDTLTVAGQFHASYTGPFGTQWFDRIEMFIFDDGTYLVWEDIIETLVAEAKTDAADEIYGFAYEDTLDGGLGNDLLVGGNENDTYIFGLGYGTDIVHDTADNILGGMTDRIVFNDDVLLEDVTFTRDGSTNDLVITLASGDVLRVQEQFEAYSTGPFGTVWFDRIENFYFSSTDETVTYDQIMDTILVEAKTSGDDSIYGYFREDVLDGGAGNDYLAGGGEGDTYHWGRGFDNDTINDSSGGIAEGADIDKVLFSADLLPTDLTIARPVGTEDLVITIIDSGETLTIKDHFLKFVLGPIYTEIEEFRFANGTVWTPEQIRTRLLSEAKTSGDDSIRGFHTADILDGGAGNDLLKGEGGGDTFVFGTGYGQDVVDAFLMNVSRDQPDTIAFTAELAPEDVTLTRNGNDLVISVTGTTDQLTIIDQFTYYNYSRVENFQFANTSWTWQDVELMFLQGTPGNDTLIGYGADDVLDGGAGNDILKGRQGNDTYVFGRGYGVDTIDDDNFGLIGDAPDRLVFGPDIVVGDLQFVRAGDDLVIRILGTDDSVTVKNHFNSYFEVSTFEFEDQTVLTAADVQVIIDNNPPGIPTHLGTAGDDTITGSYAADLIDGRGGNDILRGGNEADTYLYGLGSGNDRIEEVSGTTGSDTLKLVGLNASDVALTRAGNDLNVRIPSSGETITVQNHFIGTADGIETIAFADNTTWDRATIQANAIIVGTGGADTINGSSVSETIDGFAGVDTIDGSGGSDTYLHRAGSGDDIITDRGGSGDVDVLRLIGVNAADVTLARTGNDLRVTRADTGEVITIHYQFFGAGDGIEKVVFDDGTFWDSAYIAENAAFVGTSGTETINGTSGNNIFDGLDGADTLNGSGGSDTYLHRAGSGNDIVFDVGSSADVDILRLIGVSPSNVFLSRSGNDLLVTRVDTGEAITVEEQFLTADYGINKVVFDDGTFWDGAYIAANLALLGTSGADTINGSSGNEIIDGLGGADMVRGNGGSDTYLHRDGSGNDTINDDGASADMDVLRLIGVDASDVSLGRLGNDLRVTRADTGEIVTFQNHFYSVYYEINKVAFDDGTFWDSAYIAANTVYLGTSGVDTINGTSGANIIDGLEGADTLVGNDGSDTYLHRAGSGNDVINDNGSQADVDVLRLIGVNSGNVSLGRSGNDLRVTRADTGEIITIQNHFYSVYYEINKVVFDDGTFWDGAYIAANIVFLGTSGAETINGTSGNDIFDGLGGIDTLNGSTGSDTYLHRDGSGDDIINDSGTSGDLDVLRLIGVTPAEVTLTRSGNDMRVLRADTGEIITIQAQFSGANYGINKVVFDDGTFWDSAYIAANIVFLGTSGAETLNGTSGDDTFDGLGGADTLNGNGGNDTYLYRAGSGNDTINEGSDGTTIDKLKLVGLNASDVTLSRTGNHLFVTINGSGEQLKITDHFHSTTYGIEQFVFQDNTVWDRATILMQLPPILGTSGNDNLSGTGGDDAFKGGLGNDNTSSGSGSDIHIYASGDGNDRMDEESGSNTEIDTLWFTDINASGITLTKSGNDLMVNVTATGHQIELDEQYWSATANWGFEQIRFGDGTIWNRDTMMQNAWWNGTGGNDNLSGWASFDNIDGGLGNDTLNGGAGVDKLIGGGGNDTLTGGSGNDAIIFRAGFGNDTVTDFTAGAGSDDVIEFHDGIFADFAAVQAASQQVGSNVVITVDASNSITLQNATLASLHQDDFRHY